MYLEETASIYGRLNSLSITDESRKSLFWRDVTCSEELIAACEKQTHTQGRIINISQQLFFSTFLYSLIISPSLFQGKHSTVDNNLWQKRIYDGLSQALLDKVYMTILGKAFPLRPKLTWPE